MLSDGILSFWNGGSWDGLLSVYLKIFIVIRMLGEAEMWAMMASKGTGILKNICLCSVTF